MQRRRLINSGCSYTVQDVEAAVPGAVQQQRRPLWDRPGVWLAWLVLLGVLWLGLLYVGGLPDPPPLAPASQQTAAPMPRFDAETEAKLTTLVPIVVGGWWQGYRETTQSCRVLITDTFREVTRLGTDIVARYEPRQTRPDFCAPGTLVLADTVTQMMIQMAQDTKEILRMMQRPR
jgi:hypothetical protein